MTILSARQRVAETLEAMHLSGVLGALIPEFGNLYARVLHDLYHIYTVDRHSLVAVRELERLRTGEFKDPTPLLTEVARELPTPAAGISRAAASRYRQGPRPRPSRARRAA